MSAARCPSSVDRFRCSICLDLFTDPVSTPCGHNFCQICITTHCDTNISSTCPICNQAFCSSLQLKVNTLLSELVAQVRSEAEKESISRSDQQAAAAGDVPCDLCTGTKVKAQKSCLDCLASFCETHLEPHLTTSTMGRHQLVEPVENLETRMCPKHNKPLEIFCRSDHTCVCMMCSVVDHRSHQLVHLREEGEERKVELQETEADLQQMIQKRREKLEEIRELVKTKKDVGDREIAKGVEVFTALVELVQAGLKELVKKMEEQQRVEEREDEGLVREVEEDISELMKRSSEVQQLSCSKDHLHVLQHFSSLKAPPASKDWTQVVVRPSSCEGTVERALAQLEETLSEKMKKTFEADLKKKQQFAVDVTLDPRTAHPRLVLSGDGKQVSYSDRRQELPHNEERFSVAVCVLGTQRFSSGRFYFEVQVKGKTEWGVGVANESVNRKGDVTVNPSNGYWTVWLRDGDKYKALEEEAVSLQLKSHPEEVGVSVDYDVGVVSFYDVTAAALIHSFIGCCFTDNLQPFFSPGLNEDGKNWAPLVICPVNQTVCSAPR